MSAHNGFDGVNVTYPFKQAALDLVDLAEPDVTSIGAVNTLVFTPDRVVRGFNTDHSGLQRRWRERMGAETPGTVAILGAGGVGRAAGFAFAGLGAEEIRISDLDPGRAANLVKDLVRSYPGDLRGPDHPGRGGSRCHRNLQRDTSRYALLARDAGRIGRNRRTAVALRRRLHTGAHAVGDRATDAGLRVFDGLELFLGQAIDAFQHFTGIDLPDDVAAGVEFEMRALLPIN